MKPATLLAALSVVCVCAQNSLPLRDINVPRDYARSRQQMQQMYMYWSSFGGSYYDPTLGGAFAGMPWPPTPYLYPPQMYPPYDPKNDGRDHRGEDGNGAQAAITAPLPFVPRTPDPGDLRAADKTRARQLLSRYDVVAANVSAAWGVAESMRQRLAGQGLAVNVQTASAVARMTVFLDQAAEALRRQQWQEAETALTRTEYEIQKVVRGTGD